MKSSDFRAEARKKLDGKWGKVACITLAFYAIFFGISFVESLFPQSMRSIISILTYIIEVPLQFGLTIALFKVYNSEDVKAFDFCSYGFNNFTKAWGIFFRMLVKMIVPIVLIIISAFLFAGSISLSLDNVKNSSLATGSVAFVMLGGILYTVGIIYAIIKGYHYSLSYIIAADDESLTSKQVVDKSNELMTGSCGKLFVLQFPFIGWSILAVFTFGIGIFWLFPYIQFAIIAFYYFLSGKTMNSNAIEDPINSSNDDPDLLN